MLNAPGLGGLDITDPQQIEQRKKRNEERRIRDAKRRLERRIRKYSNEVAVEFGVTTEEAHGIPAHKDKTKPSARAWCGCVSQKFKNLSRYFDTIYKPVGNRKEYGRTLKYVDCLIRNGWSNETEIDDETRNQCKREVKYPHRTKDGEYTNEYILDPFEQCRESLNTNFRGFDKLNDSGIEKSCNWDLGRTKYSRDFYFDNKNNEKYIAHEPYVSDAQLLLLDRGENLRVRTNKDRTYLIFKSRDTRNKTLESLKQRIQKEQESGLSDLHLGYKIESTGQIAPNVHSKHQHQQSDKKNYWTVRENALLAAELLRKTRKGKNIPSAFREAKQGPIPDDSNKNSEAIRKEIEVARMAREANTAVGPIQPLPTARMFIMMQPNPSLTGAAKQHMPGGEGGHYYASCLLKTDF